MTNGENKTKNKNKHGTCMQPGEKEIQTSPYSFLVRKCQKPCCMYPHITPNRNANIKDFTCGYHISNLPSTNIVRVFCSPPPPDRIPCRIPCRIPWMYRIFERIVLSRKLGPGGGGGGGGGRTEYGPPDPTLSRTVMSMIMTPADPIVPRHSDSSLELAEMCCMPAHAFLKVFSS